MTFRDTLTRWLINVADPKSQLALRTILEPLFDRMSSVGLTISTPVISAGASPSAKMGAADSYFVVNGILVKIAASTALPALTGANAAQNSFIIVCFFVDSAGALTMLYGVAGTTLAKATWPQFPKGKALIATVIITNAGGAFVGGTTALDTATTVYIAGNEGYDPYCIVGPFLP